MVQIAKALHTQQRFIQKRVRYDRRKAGQMKRDAALYSLYSDPAPPEYADTLVKIGIQESRRQRRENRISELQNLIDTFDKLTGYGNK